MIAYARNPSIIGSLSERLALVEDELSKAGAIERTIIGADAIIRVLNHHSGDARSIKPISFYWLNLDRKEEL